MSNDEEPTRTSTAADVMKRYGCTQPTVSNWAKDGCPHSRANSGGRSPLLFDMDEVAAWVKKTRRKIKKLSRNDDDGEDSQREHIDLMHARAKYRKDLAAAEKAELELERLHGRLISAEDVKQGQLDRIARARAVLCGISASIAPDLVGLDEPEIEQMVKNAIYAALTELSREVDE